MVKLFRQIRLYKLSMIFLLLTGYIAFSNITVFGGTSISGGYDGAGNVRIQYNASYSSSIKIGGTSSSDRAYLSVGELYFNSPTYGRTYSWTHDPSDWSVSYLGPNIQHTGSNSYDRYNSNYSWGSYNATATVRPYIGNSYNRGSNENTPYSIQYANVKATSYWRWGSSSGGLSNAYFYAASGGSYTWTVTIPHGTQWDPAYFKQVYAWVRNVGTSNKIDLSGHVSHIKTCTGGNWQSDSSAHWKQCGTCGYVGAGRSGHTWTNVSNATCTSGGSRRCTTCGRTETSPALGHSWDNNTWQTNGANHWHRCTRCGASKDVAAHNWTYSNVNATTHDKACTVCAYKITGEPHNFINNKCACGRYNTVAVSFNLNKPTPESGNKLFADTVPASVNSITYTYGDKYYDAKYNLVIPSLQDYTFNGWYTAVTGGTKISEDTTVSNSNAHTLYAQWTAKPITITKLTASDIHVIEYNGQPESEYIKDHAPEDGLKYPYANVSTEVKADGTAADNYRYIWEAKTPDGEWKPLNLKGVSGQKLELSVKEASRDMNKTKFRLTVISNAGKMITSNDMELTVYHLPEIEP